MDTALIKQKISFTPGSAEVDAASGKVMQAIAVALKGCAGIQIEISGYTDSQGSEEGNRALSQARAEAVLVGLQGRQVDVSGMVAKGYGEADPIGDNATEVGRESNRRIEFVLVGQAATEQTRPADPVGEQTADPSPEAPDFSGDSSPSLAPQEQTIRPKARPGSNG